MATRFAELHPALVKKLVLVCPAGVHSDLPMLAKLVRVPGLGEMLLSLASKKDIRKNAEKAYADPNHPGCRAHVDRTLARGDVLQQQHPGMKDWIRINEIIGDSSLRRRPVFLFPNRFSTGHVSSLLNTVRNFNFGALANAFAALSKRADSVWVLWGEQDVVVPYANSQQVRKLVQLDDSHFVSVPSCGHADWFAEGHPGQTALFNTVKAAFTGAEVATPSPPPQVSHASDVVAAAEAASAEKAAAAES